MNRAILLQTFATDSKNNRLKEFSSKAINEYNRLLSERKGCKTFMQFHHKTLSTSKTNTSFNVQVRCSLIRDAWKKKTTKVNGLTVKFNVPRNCKTFNTKTNFFVELGMYPRNRIAIPIKKNRNYQRFVSLLGNGWNCRTFGLAFSKQIIAYLSKQKTELPQRKNVLGIDINAKCFAVSIVSPKGKVLKQTYFGKDIWVKRKKIMLRRALLQSLFDKGSFKARRKLIKLKTKEFNFVKNRLGEIVKEITNLALRFDANIAIENLKRFSRKGKRFNKIIMRIPFYAFRQLLESRCFDKNIILEVIDSWHTSKWCSHCGALAKGHSTNYSLFKCKCGQIVNSDRKASLAVAVKSLLERNIHSSNQTEFFQFSNRKVPVNGLFRSNDSFETKDTVHAVSTLMESQ